MTGITVLKDLRAGLGAARDQGQRPTCLAFAASDAHAALRAAWSPLSCEFAFYHAQRRAGRPPSTGATLPAVLEALRLDGQPEETGWPYLSAMLTEPAAWKPPEDVGPRYGRAGVSFAAAIDAITAELDGNNPIILLMTLSASFFAPGPDAVIRPTVGEPPDPAMRHAVVAVGHGSLPGERVTLVRNSWGPTWGAAGHAWLTDDFLRPRLFGAALLTENVDVSRHSLAG